MIYVLYMLRTALLNVSMVVQYSGILRLATPIFGISNISNFNHYMIPQINVIVVVIATITVYYIALRNMGAFLNVFAKPGQLNLVSMD